MIKIATPPGERLRASVAYKIPRILAFYIPDELASLMIWVISRSFLSRLESKVKSLCEVLSVELSCSSFSVAR